MGNDIVSENPLQPKVTDIKPPGEPDYFKRVRIVEDQFVGLTDRTYTTACSTKVVNPC